MATFYGTEGDDEIQFFEVSDGVVSDPPGVTAPTVLGDLIHGYGGNDYLDGYGGYDTLHGGDGNDFLLDEYGGGAWMEGGAGDDSFAGGWQDGDIGIHADGGDGNDIFWAGTGAGTLIGGAGNDTLHGYYSEGTDDQMSGGAGADLLQGERGDDLLSGGAGNDTLFGDGDDISWGGADTLFGGAGADHLWGDQGGDLLNGGAGDDTLSGFFDNVSDGADTLIGGAGNDVFRMFDVDSTPEAFDLIRADYAGAVAFEGAGAAGGDVIDVAAIDANQGVGGDQVFIFGGRGTGHLWLTENGTRTLVFANTDADAAPEFKLAIDDGAVRASAYTAGDFIL